MPYLSRIIIEMTPQTFTIAMMELETGVLSTLTEFCLSDVNKTSK